MPISESTLHEWEEMAHVNILDIECGRLIGNTEDETRTLDLIAEVRRLRSHLERIAEYWNGDNDPQMMADALDYQRRRKAPAFRYGDIRRRGAGLDAPKPL